MWVFILALLAAGYLVLGGLDYGAAIAGRDPGVVRPYFLGNQVWLVAAVGVLLGAFPHAEEELLAGAYPAVAVILAGAVAVVVSLLAGLFGRGWTWLFRVGGFTAAAGLGAYLGWLATGSAWGAAAGVPVVVAVMGAHGAAFAGRRWGLLAVTSAMLAAIAPLAVIAGGVSLPLADAATLRVLGAVVVPMLPVLLLVQGAWWVLARRLTPARFTPVRFTRAR
jgi:cytochrome d ubiquinol oxidase subunit II